MRRAWVAGLLALAAALPGHPVGRGQLSWSTDWLMLVPEQSARELSSPIVDLGWTRKSDTQMQLALKVPVIQAAALGLSVAQAEIGEMRNYFRQDWSGTYNFRVNQRILAAQGSLELYPGVLALRPFDDASDGNPDGFLYWPVLSMGAGYRLQSTAHQEAYSSGIYWGIEPPNDFDTVTIDYRLGFTLPLHRRLSLGAHYGREAHVETRYRGGIYTGPGDDEWMGAEAALFVPLWRLRSSGDPDEYFPGVGWVGEGRLDLSYGRTYDLRLGSTAIRSSSIRLTVPMHPALALTLGMRFRDIDVSVFERWPNTIHVKRETSSYSGHFGLTFNFGGLPWD